MKNEHKAEYEKKTGEAQPCKPKQNKITSIFQPTITADLPESRKRLIDTALEDYIITSLRPLTSIEQPCFRNLLQACEPRYHTPCRKTLLSSLKARYDIFATDLRKQVSHCLDISFTHDIWSSLNTESYGATTVHYIDNKWNMNSKVLGTKLFEGSHTAEAIADSLRSTMTSWGVESSALIGVSDNASNEKKAFDILGWKRVSCSGHNINLAVSAGLKISEVARLMRKAGSLVAYFHRSPLATGLLLQKQKLLLPQQQQGHKLITDVATRWNSTLDMLERLSEQTPAIHAALHDEALSKVSNDLKAKIFSYDEQVVIDKLLQILKPFKTPTVTLSGENLPTSAFVLPTMVKLQQHLEARDEDTNTVKKLKKEMSDNLGKRITPDEREMLLLASALHPKTKDLNFLSQDEREEVKRVLIMQAKLPKYQTQNLQQEITANVQVKHETPLPSTAADEGIPPADILASAAQNLPVKQEADLDSLVSIPPHKKAKLEEITDSWLDDVIFWWK